MFQQLVALQDYMESHPQSTTKLGKNFVAEKLPGMLCGEDYLEYLNSNPKEKENFVDSMEDVKHQLWNPNSALVKHFAEMYEGNDELANRLSTMWTSKLPHLPF